MRSKADSTLAHYLHRQANYSDLYSFGRNVLGYAEMSEQPHRLMCDSVEHGGLRQLHLWPRGTFKSSAITIGYTLYKLAQDANLRVLIANVTLQGAKSFMREIKGHYERNDKLKEIVGNQVNTESKWTETEIIIKGRRKNLKEPSIQVAGVGQSLVGQHYDLIILDDLVDKDSINTPEQIEKTKTWFRLALSLLEPDGQVIVIGTRYHYADLYAWLIDEHSAEYNPQVHAIYDSDGNSIFPSRFTPQGIESIRREQGSFIFSCQYLNNPVDDETAKFKKANLLYYTDDQLTGKQLYTTLTVDRAYSLNKTADFTGITIRSVDLDNNWWVRYAVRHKAHEGEIIAKIFDLKNHFRVDKVGIEQKAFNDTLRPVLEEEMRRRNDFFLVEELKGLTSKIARIESLVPRFESRSIFIKRDMTDLEEELLRFPSGGHDDLIDSLAYHNDLPGQPMGDIELPQHKSVFGRSGYWCMIHWSFGKPTLNTG